MAQINISEEDAKAIEELIRLARQLKVSGYLGIFTEMTANGDVLIEHIAAEKAVMRSVALAEAALDPIKNIEPDRIPKIRHNIVHLIGPLLEALAKTSPKDAPKVGMMGALKYLNDPGVQKGLGFILNLAKNLGQAMEDYQEK